MLNYAYRRRWIDDPPPRVLYPAPQKRRDDILSDQEMDRLMQSAQAMGGYPEVLVTLLANTGIRIAEACALTWGDVDFDDRAITIRESKTDAGERRLCLDAETANLLRRWFMESGRPELSTTVLAREDGTPSERHGRPRYHLRRVVAAARIGRPVGFHMLRHTHLSHLAAEGADAAALSARAGHTDPGFTARRYIHPLEQRERELADLVKPRRAQG